MNKVAKISPHPEQSGRISNTIPGIAHKIGHGFSATHFSEEMFDGSMDPLLMVDHFIMTEPTFEPHLHAGISAVTMMFEDSTGGFMNRDTLGNNIELQPGDLYWLAAARGAAHEEKPADNARVHALQIFVNLPARLKGCPARSLHVAAADIPVITHANHRIRVILGQSGTVSGATDTPEEMTMLDGFLDRGGEFTHALPEGRQAWIYAIGTAITLSITGESRVLPAGHATSIAAGDACDITLSADDAAHFVLLAGRPIGENFVKYGPLVMSTADDVRKTLAAYQRGDFGQVPG